jgi:hypothetical protein
MSTNYQITIQLHDETMQALVEGGFALFAFQPVQASAAGGQPVLWLDSKALAQNIMLSWSPAYSAYISQSRIVVNGTISVTAKAPIAFGQVLEVQQDGTVQVTGGGPSDAISILNKTSTPYTCGVELQFAEGTPPIAAFPLYGNSLDAVAPLPQLLLLFETYPAQAGQILGRTLAQGLLVDFADGGQRTVSFDINKGWSWGGASWGQVVNANTPLDRTLIHQAPLQLADAVAKMNASLR